MLTAALLRFHLLGVQSLWNDEGNSYVQATRSLSEIAANAAQDIHPPGYYGLLAVWRQLAGDSEFALRSLSTFASILTVAFTFGLGKRLLDTRAGIAAAVFTALNTFNIYYAQEARMYALLALWGAAGMWALTGVMISPQASRWTVRKIVLASLPLGLINAAGLYTQYAYPFVMLAQGVLAMVYLMSGFRPPATRHQAMKGRSAFPIGFVVANLITIALYLPWLPTAIKQITSWPSTGQVISTGDALGTIMAWLAVGITKTSVSDGIAIGVILAASVSSLVTFRRTALWRRTVPILWVLIPVGAFLLLGLFRPANLKLLLPAQVGCALILGMGMSAWWGTPHPGWIGRIQRGSAMLGFMLASAFLMLSIPPLYTDSLYRRSDYRAMAAVIAANPRPGDAIILDAPNQEEVFRYYYRGDAPVYTLPPGLGGNDAETLAAVRGIIEEYQRIFVLFWGEAERDPNHVVETTLDHETYEAGQDVWYGDVRLARYVTPVDITNITPVNTKFGDFITLVGYALNGSTAAPGDVLQILLDWQTNAVLGVRYKVFVQLLNSNGVLAAQRDSEPGGGSAPTTSWQPGDPVIDRHGVALPEDLNPGPYSLIVGLYNIDDPNQRLPVGEGDYMTLATIQVRKK